MQALPLSRPSDKLCQTSIWSAGVPATSVHWSDLINLINGLHSLHCCICKLVRGGEASSTLIPHLDRKLMWEGKDGYPLFEAGGVGYNSLQPRPITPIPHLDKKLMWEGEDVYPLLGLCGLSPAPYLCRLRIRAVPSFVLCAHSKVGQ